MVALGVSGFSQRGKCAERGGEEGMEGGPYVLANDGQDIMNNRLGRSPSLGDWCPW